MPDLHFEHPRLAALYDAGGWSADRDFCLGLADPAPSASSTWAAARGSWPPPMRRTVTT